MSINQDTGVVYDETGGSFWEINGYKPTSKRVSDGYNLCHDLMSLVRERAEIEAKYSHSLRSWNKKWSDHVGKGPEYGTTEAAWQGLFEEANRLSNLHYNIKEQLVNEVQTKVKAWQKETFHKSKLGGLKQHKELDDGFAKAQKPWAKKYDKAMKARDEYHKACKNLRTAQINERNQQGDTSVSEDQKRKNIQKINEWEQKKDGCQDKYEKTLQEVTDYNARYMEDMSEVYNKCQELEGKRQDFFKDVLFDIQKCLNLSTDPAYSQIYNDLRSTIANADSQKDLKWWSVTHGEEMAMRWPEFEEYEPNQANIGKRASKKASDAIAKDNITLTTVIRKDDQLPQQRQSYQSQQDKRDSYYSDTQQEPSPMPQRISTDSSLQSPIDHPLLKDFIGQGKYDAALNPFADPDEGEDLSDIDDHAEHVGNGGDNPFGDDDDDDDEDYLADDGRAGVPVRALYDYDATEEDELTFKAGDEFEKLEEEDEQGWCKGRLNDRVGLYPANFCAEI